MGDDRVKGAGKGWVDTKKGTHYPTTATHGARARLGDEERRHAEEAGHRVAPATVAAQLRRQILKRSRPRSRGRPSAVPAALRGAQQLRVDEGGACGTQRRRLGRAQPQPRAQAVQQRQRRAVGVGVPRGQRRRVGGMTRWQLGGGCEGGPGEGVAGGEAGARATAARGRGCRVVELPGQK